jgi:two-component system osmolarity sensor histidine kinase EnvZ
MFSYLKKALPKSISSRFFTILIFPVVLSQIIFGIVFFGKYSESVMRTLTQQIAENITLITKLLDFKCSENIIQSIGANIEIISHSKLQKTGLEKNRKFYRLLKKALNKKEIKEYYIKPFKNRIIVFVESTNRNNVYKISLPFRSMYTRVIPMTFGWSLASSIVLLIIAFIFLKNQIRPIKKLATALESFGQGDETTFVPEGAIEIKQVGRAFCEMQSNLRKLTNSRITTLAGISHDLRTPLTKMKLQLAMMPKSKEVEFLINDVNLMTRITESFISYTIQQNKEMFIHRNLYFFLNELVHDYSSNVFHIHITGDRTVDICIKYISLKRAFGNIILNAKKYSENMYISFAVHDNTIVLNFEDDGPGIDPRLMDVIFEPFVSKNQARTHGIDSETGLGLSIARDAITDHGGSIEAGNSKTYGGACFTVIFSN